MKAMIAIAATLLIGFAHAASDWANQTAVQVDDQTVTFVKKAAQGGMGEVALGRWALTRSDDAQVKMFSQHLIDDHGKANAELRQLAERLGISMPEPLTDKQKDLQERLTNLQGNEFKREFFAGAVADHKEDIDEFTAYAQNGKNEDVRAFAQRQLPVLKDHLRMAQDFDRGVSVNAGFEQRSDVGYRTEEFRHRRHHRWHRDGDVTINAGYETSYSGCDSCNSCSHHKSCSSCNSCNSCEQSQGVVYDNDWRAGTTELVTGEQVDQEECTACNYWNDMWR